MPQKKYLYMYDYHHTEKDLCRLEAKHLFGEQPREKWLLSDTAIEPSGSAINKKRLDIVATARDYNDLLPQIEAARIAAEGFKVEYLVMEGDETRYAARLDKMRDVGYRIEGIPDYHRPTCVYGVCYVEGHWLFGLLIKDRFDWHRHKQKPRSYSNSITMSIAKALVNIAAKGKKEATLLDACCGVGTILLEACYAGYLIEGCDFNRKICADARENVAHFGYTATVHCSDIGSLEGQYDAAIADLPYNLLSDADDADISHIIESAARLSPRLVIVSTTDIAQAIGHAGFAVTDRCKVSKKGKRSFARVVWVCDKIPKALHV